MIGAVEPLRYDDLARTIDQGATGVALVGVDGPSGSGKSTFARRLAAACADATVVEVDDFLSWGDPFAWWPRVEREVLRPLLEGRAVRVQVRDWERDPLGSSLGPWRDSTPARCVILEGVGASRRELADLLTLAVWVEAPVDLRLRRGIERDGDGMREHWLGFMAVESAFFADDGARERADLRVDGDPVAPHDRGSVFIGAWTGRRTVPGHGG